MTYITTLRICASCNLPRSSHTANQYGKGRGLSQCAGCIRGRHVDRPATRVSDSGRYNRSRHADALASAFENPFAQGAFRLVAKGTYSSGPRSGQACVFKWFKTGAVFEADYFTLDIKAVHKALEIVHTFNELNVVNKTVSINVPTVWRHKGDDQRAGHLVLCEPFIRHYQKFNSNTGWNDQSMAWGEVMQALSHFSYHLSGGQFVLCDLQGGIYRKSVVLSDPVILSRNRDYGVTDLGPRGISSFFNQHCCNRFCHSNWSKPANTTSHFRPVPGTRMMRSTVATVGSRSPQSDCYSEA